MKIIHLCGGGLESGATLGALSLHQALIDQGVESSLIFSKGDNHSNTPDVSPFFNSKLARKLFDSSSKWIEPQLLRTETKRKIKDISLGIVGHPFFLKKREIEAADIIHLHWINSRFIRTKAIQHFKKPIVWTLRDAWPYTGGCHYTTDCEGYKTGCGQCPLLDSSNPNDRSRQVLDSKQKHLPEGIRYVALSNWTAEQARASSLLKNKSIDIILNSIGSCYFKPSDLTKEQARSKFNLPTKKTIILAGAARLDSQFKGYKDLLPEFPDNPDSDLHLVTFGRISEELKSRIKAPCTHLDSIASGEELQALYHAADIFIAPSTQEAFGKTLAEAGASGLPVICYDTGGPKDIVLHRVTGYRIKTNCIDEFISATLDLVAQPDTRNEMSAAAIRHTHESFRPSTAAQKHIGLYRELLNNKQIDD
jgi:glycosyltransferase involved in cell wall biosynthesis